MLAALADTYPAARISFLDGDRAPLLALRADFDRRHKGDQRLAGGSSSVGRTSSGYSARTNANGIAARPC